MVKRKDISHFNLLDWNFQKEDSRVYLHNFCWYPSRFIPIIPAHLINALSKKNDVVLDPFCGVGTTLIEALKLQRNAIGIDLNPVGCFIAKTKCRILLENRVNFNKLTQHRDFIYSLCTEDLFTRKQNLNIPLNKIELLIPNFDSNREWYNLDTLRMLTQLYLSIENMPNGLTKDICKIFFISILMPSSGFEVSKPYTYFADNVKPKVKLYFKHSLKLYLQKLDKFITEYKPNQLPIGSSLTYQVFNNDARDITDLITNKVDLIVTSPPYLNVTDYLSGFRLAYLWYDFTKNNDLTELKLKEIGARYKRKSPHSFDEYIWKMQHVLSGMADVLKRNGYMCLVLGESKKYASRLNHDIAKYISSKLKLEYVDSFDREISKKFFIHPSGGGVQTEEILIFRKGG